jgi:putative hydrolase of the HAD superfamily
MTWSPQTSEYVGFTKPDAQVSAYVRDRQSILGYKHFGFLHVAQCRYHGVGNAKKQRYAVCWIERCEGKGSTGTTPPTQVVTVPH